MAKRPKWHWWLGGLIAIMVIGGVSNLTTKPSQQNSPGNSQNTSLVDLSSTSTPFLVFQTADARQTATTEALAAASIRRNVGVEPTSEPVDQQIVPRLSTTAPLPPTSDVQLTREVVSSMGTATAYAQPVPTWTPEPKPVAAKPPPVKVQPKPCNSGVRIGATCNDGTHSSATGRGACSHHKGVSVWLYASCP